MPSQTPSQQSQQASQSQQMQASLVKVSPQFGLSDSTMMMQSLFGVGPSSTWRMQERIRTVSVGLVLCLHLGVDPPDIVKTGSCAKLECWCDPMAPRQTAGGGGGGEQGGKPLDVIGRNLVGQYEFWQPKARYKLVGDPTIEEVRKLAQSLRKSAKEERALLHWNGHGTPRPTKVGELWVFNRQFTQYIPLAVADVIGWLGLPCTLVLDCSGAGNAFDALLGCLPQQTATANAEGRFMIVLAACQANEILPMCPELPADLFTSCLTTPLEIAIRWHFLQANPLVCKDGAVEGLMTSIPGRLNDRKSVLGELHWVFTAITDTIAWLTFPRETFKALFRQDLMTASLFRNFLLAVRIMRSYQCTPQSWPPIPPGSSTIACKFWLVWDHLLDSVLALGDRFAAKGSFFTEQMDSFQAWINEAALLDATEPNECLPLMLQVLLSQSQRARALKLILEYIDFGPAFVKEALDVGILPYVQKLLQSPCLELRPPLLRIWTRILAFDPTIQKDLVKDDSHAYFARFILGGEGDRLHALINYTLAYQLAEEPLKLPDGLLLQIYELAEVLLCTSGDGATLLWTVNCIGCMWREATEAKIKFVKEVGRDLYDRFILPLITSQNHVLRAAACYAAQTFVTMESSLELPNALLDLEQDILLKVTSALLMDASETVRVELVICLSKYVAKHFNKFALAAFDLWEKGSCTPMVPLVSGDIVKNPSVYSILWEAILALSLDQCEAVARLASSLTDEIHMSFLFLGSGTAGSKELLFVHSEENLRRSPSPNAAGAAGMVLPSALPLVSTFISSCLAQQIDHEKVYVRTLVCTHAL